MNRIVPLLTVLVACSLAACGDDSDKVQILLFQASPNAIENGQSTKLVFAVQPSTAKITITEIGDVTGKTEQSVTPMQDTTYQLTASFGKALANQTVKVTVGATSAAAIKVQPAITTPTAGAQFAVTVTVLGPSGNPAPGFRGTVHIGSNDASAVLPADIVFSATLKTAGDRTLTATDTTGKAHTSGSASLTVQPAAAHAYQLQNLPDSATAGQRLTLTIKVLDVFGNVATAYGGSVHLTSADSSDDLPPDDRFTAGTLSVSLMFTRTGNHIAQVQDVASSLPSTNTSTVAVKPAAPRVVLTLPADANSGYPVSVGVAVKDLFDNAIPTYTGTVSFASTDSGSGAAVPADINFTGTEGGATTTSATFVTIGTQTLSATATGTPQGLGSAAARIHGLVYTPPATGKVRLIANSAQTSAQTIQLDLVANERLEVGIFGGPGSFSAGMNLPLDTTRVGAGNPLFARGTALPAGNGVPASVGVLGPDHVLYTGVSRKRVTGTAIGVQDTDVPAGQVFYSVRLKLTQNGAVGTVFDGAQPTAMFRAGVRSQFGDDFVGQSDFGVGKLEIR
jgi:protocatechuate 3,4-dioxygenase beta subunit